MTLLLTLVTDNSLSAHAWLPARGHEVFDTLPLLLIAGYRCLFAIVGCHVAARLAPSGQPRIPYALALGGLLLALNVVGAMSLRGLVPFWYSLSSIALMVPCAIIGGGTATRAMRGQPARNQ